MLDIRKRFDKRSSYSRRSFLKAASFPVFLPWLEALSMTPQARAADNKPIRLVTVNTLHGIPGPLYYSDWVQNEVGPLGQLSTILSPLEKHRENLMVISGTDMLSVGSMKNEFKDLRGIGHQYANECCLTGDHRGASIDYKISEKLGSLVPHRRVLLEVQGGWNKEISFDEAHQPLNYFTSREAAYKNFFGADFNPTPASNQSQDTQFDGLFSQLLGEINKVKRVVSQEDVMRIEQHVQALEDFRNQISFSSERVCSAPATPNGGFASGGNSGTERAIGQSLDLIAHTFACDMSRVATLQIHGIQSGTNYRWVIGSNKDHHGISHHDNRDSAMRQLVEIRKWHAEQIGKFLDQLASMPDGNGESVLDNTILLWSTEVSEPNRHTVSNMPYLIVAGKGTGLAQGGVHMRFAGRSTNDLLSAIAKAMNVPINQGQGDARFHIGPSMYNQGPLDIFS